MRKFEKREENNEVVLAENRKKFEEDREKFK